MNVLQTNASTDAPALPVQMQTVESTSKVLVQPGTYFLGDPCYAFEGSDGWMELLRSCCYFGWEQGPGSGPIGYLNGLPVLGFSTAHGDGTYLDQHRNAYAVDAGLLGLVPQVLYEATAGKKLDRFDGDLGKIVVFTEPALCSRSNEGVLRFGPYSIDTDPTPDDDDNDWG